MKRILSLFLVVSLVISSGIAAFADALPDPISAGGPKKRAGLAGAAGAGDGPGQRYGLGLRPGGYGGGPLPGGL